MAISKIVGVSPVNYVSKKSGEVVEGVQLHLLGTSLDTFGESVSTEFISARIPVYACLTPFSAAPLELVGYSVDIDHNQRGFLSAFRLIPKSDEVKK